LKVLTESSWIRRYTQVFNIPEMNVVLYVKVKHIYKQLRVWE
jgi:hypothetical protein